MSPYSLIVDRHLDTDWLCTGLVGWLSGDLKFYLPQSGWCSVVLTEPHNHRYETEGYRGLNSKGVGWRYITYSDSRAIFHKCTFQRKNACFLGRSDQK